MAEVTIPVSSGSGNNISGFSTTTNGRIRQAIVIADPSTDANTTPVHATLGAGINLLGANGTALVTSIAGAPGVGGDTASAATDAGNPVKVGGVARTAPPTAVTAGQRVNSQYDIYGKQVVREGGLREDLGNQATTITSSVAETTIVTADATYKLDIYGLLISNTSTTKTSVTIKDSTAGTTRFIIRIPADDVRGFMVSPSGAHKQNAANNNWTATCADSVASIQITVMWVRSL